MKILAIETSCDDTCIAIVEVKPVKGSAIPRFNVLSNVISSQVKIHEKYGGVVPTLAKRAHEENLIPVLKQALSKARVLKSQKSKIPPSPKDSEGHGKSQNYTSKLKSMRSIFSKEPELLEKFLKNIPKIKKPKTDLIAVTNGPGLEPALWTGVNFARALSYWWHIPLLGVDHMEGHVAANFLPQERGKTDTKYTIQNTLYAPAICLAVSGGHTQLILIKDINKYKLIGETVDDAAGEGFDKVARLLGLGFPGGPEIARLAKMGNSKTFNFARPMINSNNYNFSFSGLKTSVLYEIKKLLGIKLNEPIDETRLKAIPLQTKQDLAASFQQAAVDVLISKTIKAAKKYNVKTIMLAGGVAANKELRKQLGEKISAKLPNTRYQMPNTRLATDNAAMIGVAAYFRKNRATLTRWKTLKADGNLKIK